MTDSPGTLFDSLLAVMARLRAEEGCPWDREQTRASLQPYLIEETYEALEALEGGERDAMMEELGDLLFQVVFHAQVARELGEFTMADLLERLVAKMVRRHPHVFGEAKVSTAREAFSQWERIKHEEATPGGEPPPPRGPLPRGDRNKAGGGARGRGVPLRAGRRAAEPAGASPGPAPTGEG